MPGRRIKHTNNPSLNQRRESFQINKNLNAPFKPRPGNLQQLRPEENYVQASDFSKEISNKFFRQQQNIPATTISSDQLNRTIDANIESKAIKAQKIRANDEGFEFNQVEVPQPLTRQFIGIDDLEGIEQTFKLILTSYPFDNQKRPLSSWPTDFRGPSPNENLKLINDQPQYYPLGNRFVGPHYRIILDDELPFDIDFPAKQIIGFGTSNAPMGLNFNFKKNKRYRIDLSHPSLSVNPNNWYTNIEDYKSNLSASPSYSLTGAPENKFVIFDYSQSDKVVVDNTTITDRTSPRTLGSQRGDQYNYFDRNESLFDFYTRENNIIDEGITYNGEPGTPGAYMDIVTFETFPDTFFIFNSALNLDTNSSLEFFRSDRTFYQRDAIIPSPRIFAQCYDTNEFIAVTGNRVATEVPHLSPMVYNYNILSGGDVLQNWNYSQEFKDLFSSTLSCFVEKILKKVPKHPKFNYRTLSCLNFSYNSSPKPIDELAPYGELGSQSYTQQFQIPPFTDYMRVWDRDRTGNAKLTGWNTEWWGYSARDILNVSGIAASNSFVNSHQGWLLTPRHVMFTEHWGSLPSVGSTIGFLEHNTGTPVSAIVTDIVSSIGKKGATKFSDIESVINSPLYQPTSVQDARLCKIDRDITQPNPDFQNSDGSVKVYKVGRMNTPVYWNFFPEKQSYLSGYPFITDTAGRPRPELSEKGRATIDSNIAFNYRDYPVLSAFDHSRLYPAFLLTGLGSFGAQKNTRWNAGDDYGMIHNYRLPIINNFYYNSSRFDRLSGVESSIFAYGGGQLGVHSNFYLLSSNPYLQFNIDLQTPHCLSDNPPAIQGDSSNPIWYLVDNDIILAGSVSGPKVYAAAKNAISGVSSPMDLYNLAIDYMGNTEGHYISAYDLT